MADSVEISFVDENDFVKEEKWYFLLYTMRFGVEARPNTLNLSNTGHAL